MRKKIENRMKCRRCGKIRKISSGKEIEMFLSSYKYGSAEARLPNPICNKCIDEFGNWWYQHIHNGIRA